MAKTFETWRVEKEPWISDTLTLCSKPLSDEPEEMFRQLRDIDARLGYCFYILSQADSWLDREESQTLKHINDADGKRGNSDTEKKIMVKAMVSEVREFRDTCEGLTKAIQNKVMLGESRLAFLRSLPKV